MFKAYRVYGDEGFVCRFLGGIGFGVEDLDLGFEDLGCRVYRANRVEGFGCGCRFFGGRMTCASECGYLKHPEA